MNTQLNSFVILSASVLIVLSISAAAVAVAGSVLYRSTVVLMTAAGLIGGWIAGRHAADTPVSKSGRFRTTPDI